MAEFPGHHVLRHLKVIQVVSLRRCDGETRRRTLLAPGAANPLHIIRRGRRHGAENHAGEVTDVDAHFERRRARKEIGVRAPAFRWPGHEAIFYPLPLSPRQQARVLGAANADHVASPIKIAEVILNRGLRRVRAMAGRSQARRIVPQRFFRRRTGDGMAAMAALHQAHLGGQQKLVGGNSPHPISLH